MYRRLGHSVSFALLGLKRVRNAGVPASWQEPLSTEVRSIP
jgi:hypothetical protein